MIRYTTPVELRVALHSKPLVAEARKQMAETYRAVRRKNPRMARLLWRRCKAVEQQVADAIFSSNATSLLS